MQAGANVPICTTFLYSRSSTGYLPEITARIYSCTVTLCYLCPQRSPDNVCSNLTLEKILRPKIFGQCLGNGRRKTIVANQQTRSRVTGEKCDW